MNIAELSAMDRDELRDYLSEYEHDMVAKSVIQYVKCPYTRKFASEELVYKEPLKEVPNGSTNYAQHDDKQQKALMLIIQQIKNMAVDDILGTVKNLSAKLNRNYQELLTKVLTKELTFDIISEELKEYFPDTNVFQPALGRPIENIEEIIPARVFQVKKEFERLIAVVCVNYVKFFKEDGTEVEAPSFTKSLIALAGAIPMVFDGFRFKDYYLLNDLIIFGDFKRGKTRTTYEKRHRRLKQDVNEFNADPKVANKNIMVPSQFELQNIDNWETFKQNIDKSKTYIIKSLDDVYEFYWQENYS